MEKDWKIDFELLQKVLENDRNCLCKLNTKCPCSEFAFNKKCHCGVFSKNE